MSARGNGGTHHCYACSGRQKLGRRACDGDRLSKDKLEDAVLRQLADTYRTGTLIRQAIEQAAAHDDSERDEIEARRAGIAVEIKRAERAIERYYAAFEAGDLLDAMRQRSRRRRRSGRLLRLCRTRDRRLEIAVVRDDDDRVDTEAGWSPCLTQRSEAV